MMHHCCLSRVWRRHVFGSVIPWYNVFGGQAYDTHMSQCPGACHPHQIPCRDASGAKVWRNESTMEITPVVPWKMKPPVDKNATQWTGTDGSVWEKREAILHHPNFTS